MSILAQYSQSFLADTLSTLGFVEGQDAGLDRVVFEGTTGVFVGIFTHRGEEGNNLHQVAGLGTNPNYERPAVETEGTANGPVNLGVDPQPWLWGTNMDGSGGLWYKRDSATTPGGSKGGNDGNGDGGNSTKPTDAVCGPGQGDPTKTYDLAYGKDAINYFCTQGGTRQIAAGGTYNKETIYGYQDKNGKTTSVALITRMYYVNVDGCSTKAGAVYEPSVQECKDNFGAAMNQCQTGTTSKKAASYKAFDKGDKGCVAFDLMPCPEVDGKASGDCDPFYGAYNKLKI